MKPNKILRIQLFDTEGLSGWFEDKLGRLIWTVSCPEASQPCASMYLLLGELDHAHQVLFSGQQMGNRPWLGRALTPASGRTPSTYQVLQCIQGLQR